MKLKRGQRLIGRITSDTADKKRHAALVSRLNNILERASDSAVMDAVFEAREIEELFQCAPISVLLPPNEWEGYKDECHRDQVGHERWFALSLYVDRVKDWLEKQGIGIEDATEHGSFLEPLQGVYTMHAERRNRWRGKARE